MLWEVLAGVRAAPAQWLLTTTLARIIRPGFAVIGDESIGALVVEGIGRSSAILLRNHGVFTIGPTAIAAVKAAVMVEDVAATVWLALQLGTPETLAEDIVEQLHRRYRTVYGQ